MMKSSRLKNFTKNTLTLYSLLLLTSNACGAGQVVINEFHYNAENESSLEEFIELHNPGDASYDLTGHTIANAVTFAFPAGTSIPAGGYLVISENPSVMSSAFGVTSLGPWAGGLKSSGEKIELRNALNIEIDSVNYKSGFPWPTMASGAGPSAELINPELDNNLGSSWRSSGISYIPLLANGWKLFKGLTQAPSTSDTWRQWSYNDSTWQSGRAGFGYGNYDEHNTVLTDMQNSYTSVYLRKTFSISSGQMPTAMRLQFRIDDGCVIWIKGREVVRKYLPLGNLPHNATATGHTRAWEEVTLSSVQEYLRDGVNVIAVHAINTDINSSDLSFDMSLTALDASAVSITPGAANSMARPISLTPPSVRSVSHSPQQPTAGTPVVITATGINDPNGLETVSLSYQLVDPGNFIRKNDPAYATSWTTLAMNDSGLNGDLAAGDGNFTVILPDTLQTHRRLIRYRVSAVDALGNSQVFPYEDDEQPNFAYFVYNGIPSWTGSFRPSAHNGYPALPTTTFSQSVMESMPAIHLIANATDVSRSQYDSNFDNISFNGALVQRGIVYDHVEFRNRGTGSTYVSGKNKWKILFNRARDFQAYDNYGQPYKETWNELPINSNASPWVPVNRGSAGIEESASHRLYQLAGMAALNTQYFQLRVIDQVSEDGPNQYGGDLWGLYLGFEPTEGNFLDERDLPDGNLYSIEGGNGDKERQGPPPAVNNGSDWVNFKAGVIMNGQTEAWYRANIDLNALFSFSAINRLIGNVDLRLGDNYRIYLRPTDNRWVVIPYDLDMMYAPAHHWRGQIDGIWAAGVTEMIRAISRHPNIAREYRNRCREILSLAASDGSGQGGQIGQLFAEYANFVNPTGQAATWADIDAAMWNTNPLTEQSRQGTFYRNVFFAGHGVNGPVQSSLWRRDLPLAPDYGADYSNHEGMTQWFVNYCTDTWVPNTLGETWNRKSMFGIGTGDDTANLTRQRGYGYKYLEFEANNGGWIDSTVNPPSMPLHADFPSKPIATATTTSFQTNALSFSTSAFADPQGANTHASSQWRIAQISTPNIPRHVSGQPWKYELESIFTSPELPAGTSSFGFPDTVAKAGMRYRVRVRHKDTSGNWSYWSDPVQFTASEPPGTLLHYWNFNDVTPVTDLLVPTQTREGGSMSLTGSYESGTGQNFNASNAQFGDAALTHFRLNNPSTAGNRIVFTMPTTNHRDVVFKYETRRSGQGAGTQIIEYTTNGNTWTQLSSVTILDADPQIIASNFSQISAVNNNPLFAVRITFQQGSGGTAGNNRFDNVTLTGTPLNSYNLWKLANFTNLGEPDYAAISSPAAIANGQGTTNLMRYALDLGRNESIGSKAPSILGNTYRFQMDTTKTDIIYRVLASTDLINWSEVLYDSTQANSLQPVNGMLALPIPTNRSRCFMRLEISLRP